MNVEKSLDVTRTTVDVLLLLSCTAVLVAKIGQQPLGEISNGMQWFWAGLAPILAVGLVLRALNLARRKEIR